MKDSRLIVQGSPEWFKVKFGRFSSSKVSAIISEPNKKTGEYKLTKGAKTYIEHTAMEFIIQDRLSDFQSTAMKNGTDNEINAAKAYQRKNGVFAVSTGFWKYGEHSGASPDKLVGLDGGAEFKSPELKAHTKYLLMDSPSDLLTIKKEYFWQCTLCILATGRKWWDFVSYCPDKRLPEHLHLAQLRIHRDDEKIKQLEACLRLAVDYKIELLGRWLG